MRIKVIEVGREEGPMFRPEILVQITGAIEGDRTIVLHPDDIVEVNGGESVRTGEPVESVMIVRPYGAWPLDEVSIR